MTKEKFTMRVAAYLVLVAGGAVLLSRRKNSPHYNDMYSMVAGHVDGRETVAAAMLREAKEEANLDIKEHDLEIAHTMHYMGGGPEYIYFFLTAKKWDGEPTNMEPEKCADLAWFPVDSLPANTIPYIHLAIENIQKGVPFSEYREPDA